ncbi:Citrate synthase [Trichinella pseudospiralis]
MKRKQKAKLKCLPLVPSQLTTTMDALRKLARWLLHLVEELKLREHRPTNRPTATTTTAAALWRIRVCSKAVGKACAMLRGSDQGASKIRRSSSLRNH